MRREARPPDYTCVRRCAASIYDRDGGAAAHSPKKVRNARRGVHHARRARGARNCGAARPPGRRLLGHAARPAAALGELPAIRERRRERAAAAADARGCGGGGARGKPHGAVARGARGAGDAHAHLRPARALHHRVRRRERRRRRRARRPAGGAVGAGSSAAGRRRQRGEDGRLGVQHGVLQARQVGLRVLRLRDLPHGGGDAPAQALPRLRDGLPGPGTAPPARACVPTPRRSHTRTAHRPPARSHSLRTSTT